MTTPVHFYDLRQYFPSETAILIISGPFYHLRRPIKKLFIYFAFINQKSLHTGKLEMAKTYILLKEILRNIELTNINYGIVETIFLLSTFPLKYFGFSWETNARNVQ